MFHHFSAIAGPVVAVTGVPGLATIADWTGWLDLAIKIMALLVAAFTAHKLGKAAQQ